MHSCTTLARRSSAHSVRAWVQKPSSSVVPPSVRSVCFTQQPSRWTIFTEVQAHTAAHATKTLVIPVILPLPRPVPNMGTPARGRTLCREPDKLARRVVAPAVPQRRGARPAAVGLARRVVAPAVPQRRGGPRAAVGLARRVVAPAVPQGRGGPHG